MVKIDRVEDLPDWFNLAKYEGTRDYGAADWFQALYVRQLSLSLVDHLDCPLAGYYQSSVESIRSNPAALATDEPHTVAQTGAYMRLRMNKPVRSMRYLDLAKMKEHADDIDKQNEIISEAISELDDPAEKEKVAAFALENHEKMLWEALTQGLTESNLHLMKKPVVSHIFPDETLKPSARVAVLVNLGASDTVIKKAFNDWLAEARAEYGQKPKPKLLYERWARYAILPYLDLMIWAQETATTIPDRVIAAAILPRREDGIDNLRKTTKPLANALMGSLAELQALAVSEAESIEP